MAGNAWHYFYLAAIGVLVAASLIIGGWWFVSGAGERRLRDVLEAEFGQMMTNSNHNRTT